MSETGQQIALARSLLAGSFRAVLSTTSIKLEGYPFGSLVPYCLDGSNRNLLLLSHLSEHTRNLEADPRCASTLTELGRCDIQQLARLTGMADATRMIGQAKVEAAQRYLRYFPSGRPYFERLNFHFYRLQPRRFYLVGGFGAARWFGTSRILQESPLTSEQEVKLIEELNQDLSLVQRIAVGSEIPDSNTAMSVAGVDGTGIDLLQEDRLFRCSLPGPLSSVEQIRESLL